MSFVRIFLKSVFRRGIPGVTLSLVCFLYGAPLFAAKEGLVEKVLAREGEERVRALFNLVDTSSVLRSSPELLTQFLTNLAEKGGRDVLLRQYIKYFREVGTTVFEREGEARIRIYEAGCERFRKERSRRLEAVCLHYVAQENFLLGNYGVAFDHSLRSMEILKELGYRNIPEIGKYLHDVALNYYYFRDYERVNELMYKALDYPAFNPNLDIQRYNTLALSYKNTGRADSAVAYFKKAGERSEFHRDSTWITLTAGNLGAVHAARGEYTEALPLLRQDYEYNRSNTQMPEMARNAALSIADIWLRLNRPDSAMFYLLESEVLNNILPGKRSFGNQQRNEDYLKSYYDILNRYHHATGHFGLAYHYLDSLHRISSELDSRYNSMLAQMAEDKLRIQRYISDIELERETRRAVSLRWLLAVAVLLFCFVVLGLLYYLNRVSQAKHKAVMQLKEREILSKQELTQAAFERAKDQLRHQLSLLEKKNQIIAQLKGDMEKKHSGIAASPELVEETLAKLASTRLLTQEDWIMFRRRFNTVFNHSLDELKESHPDLTQSEERIYALIQLDVGTRQMASMLGISPESVRKARYRLNKKLKSA